MKKIRAVGMTVLFALMMASVARADLVVDVQGIVTEAVHRLVLIVLVIIVIVVTLVIALKKRK